MPGADARHATCSLQRPRRGNSRPLTDLSSGRLMIMAHSRAKPAVAIGEPVGYRSLVPLTVR